MIGLDRQRLKRGCGLCQRIESAVCQGEVMHMTTGQLIRAARKKAGVTRTELAQKLNIPFQSVSQWERDLRNPKIETLNRIAAALGVDPVELTPVGKALLMAKEQHIKAYIEDDVPLPPFFCENPTPEDLRRERLLAYYDYLLNEEGKKEAVKRVHELTEIPRYQPPQIPPRHQTAQKRRQRANRVV